MAFMTKKVPAGQLIVGPKTQVLAGPKLVSGPAARVDVLTPVVVDVGQIAIASQAGDVVIAWVNGVAKQTGGQFGGFEATPRSSRRASSSYRGVDVVGMTIPLLLDGWSEQLSVAPARRLLERFAGPSGALELTPPAPVFISGSVPLPNRWWVIASLEPGDNVLLRARDGSCLRADYELLVIEPPVDGVILTNGRRYTVRKGDTLTSIAARQLGNAKRWKEIRNAKGAKIRDPKSIKAGQIVQLP